MMELKVFSGIHRTSPTLLAHFFRFESDNFFVEVCMDYVTKSAESGTILKASFDKRLEADVIV